MQEFTLKLNTNENKIWKSIFPFLAVSILSHLVFFAMKYNDLIPFVVSQEDEHVITLKLNQSSQFKKQIVQTLDSQENKSKDKAFLGEKNNSYDRETVASKVGSFQDAGLGVENGQISKAKPSEAARKSISQKDFTIDKVDFSKSKNKELEKMVKEAALPTLGIQKGKRGLTGMAQSNDFVEDIPLGDFTKLNTVEYKFYGFYFRIKQKLEQHWGHSIKEKADKIYRQGRKIASDVNHVTSLVIIMDGKGKIIDVKVKSSSGINELDEAAVESFNKAGPFPNPPKDLVRNGKAVIEWGFVVKS